MKKLLLGTIALAMVISLAPTMSNANELPSVGVWACPLPVDAASKAPLDPKNPGVGWLPLKPKGIKGSKDAHCHAGIPVFPSLDPQDVTLVGGKIYKYEFPTENKPPVPPVEVEKDNLTNGGISYFEPTCAAGIATGILNIGGEPYGFTYVRVGAVAVVAAVNTAGGEIEILLGAIAFDPKPAGGPTQLVAACSEGVLGPPITGNLRINFYGGGVYLEPVPLAD